MAAHGAADEGNDVVGSAVGEQQLLALPLRQSLQKMLDFAATDLQLELTLHNSDSNGIQQATHLDDIGHQLTTQLIADLHQSRRRLDVTDFPQAIQLACNILTS